MSVSRAMIWLPEGGSAHVAPRMIPASLEDVSPAWLTDVLRSSGVLESGEVVSCDVSRIGADFGFASQIGRIVPVYEDESPPAPKSMVVKLSVPTADPELRRLLIDKTRSEAGFYRDIAPRVGIRVPRCYFVADDPSTGGIALLLEDLTEARFGDDSVGCTLGEAELVVTSLATMHARFWNDASLDRLDWLRRWGKLQDGMRRYEGRRARFLERYAEFVTAETRRVTQAIGQEHVPALERLAGPPLTLLHVDTHLDNVAWVKRGRTEETLLFDWQGVSIGLCVVDLALFLTSALRGDGRHHEPALIEHYHRGLVRGGVSGYGLGQLIADHRVAVLRWWIGTVSGLGSAHAASWGGRQAALARDSVHRWNVVIRDLKLGELL